MAEEEFYGQEEKEIQLLEFALFPPGTGFGGFGARPADGPSSGTSPWGVHPRDEFIETPGEKYALEDLMDWRYGNLCYFLTIAALFLFSVSGIVIDDTYRAVWGFCAVILAALPAIFERKDGWIFPWPAKFLIGLTLVMHIGGGINSWYFALYPVYDKIAHLVASMTLALLLFLLLVFLEYYHVVRLGRRTIVLAVLVIPLCFGLCWEYAEYVIDQNLLSTYFVTFYDSIMDNLFNILGAGYIAFHANEYLKLEPPEKVYRRFVKWVE
jgi:hypothetical protein